MIKNGKKILHLKNKDQARAMMYFLAKEIARHEKDIQTIWADMASLSAKWNIPIPQLPDPNEWVQI